MWKLPNPPVVGQEVVVHVHPANRPEGWWMGAVTSADPLRVEITGGIRRHNKILTYDSSVFKNPDGIQKTININFDAYSADEVTLEILRYFLWERESLSGKLDIACIQRDELRRVFSTMKVEAK